MRIKKAILPLVLISLMITSCARLMVSVVDRDKAAASSRLEKGNSVVVHLPTVDKSLINQITKGKMTERGFASMIQQDFIIEFNDRGIIATEGNNEDGAYLKVNIIEYKRGIGLFRAFQVPILSGILGKSHLSGTAILSTPSGKREVEFDKRGQVYGKSQIGDQTKKNIKWVESATVSKLTK